MRYCYHEVMLKEFPFWEEGKPILVFENLHENEKHLGHTDDVGSATEVFKVLRTNSPYRAATSVAVITMTP